MLECNFCSWQGLESDLQKNKHCPKCSSPNVKKIINTMTNKVQTAEDFLKFNSFGTDEQKLKAFAKLYLEAFAEDVKESLMNEFNEECEMVLNNFTIDEIKQKYIDKL